MNLWFARWCIVACSSACILACSSSDSPPSGPTSGQGGGSPGDGSSGAGGAAGGGAGAGGGDASSLPPIDPSTALGSLTDAQKAQLCDWAMSELGGYGLMSDCGNSISVANSKDQAECVSSKLQYNCTVTVGQFETCMLALAPSHGCISPTTECRPLGCI